MRYDALCSDTICCDTLCSDTLCCDALRSDTLRCDALCTDLQKKQAAFAAKTPAQQTSKVKFALSFAIIINTSLYDCKKKGSAEVR